MQILCYIFVNSLQNRIVVLISDQAGLTHFILNDLFWHIYWKSPFSISGVLGYVSQDIFVGKWLNN